MSVLRGDLVALRDATKHDAPYFRSLLEKPEIHKWWMWPDMETDLATIEGPYHQFSITVSGDVVGMISWHEVVSSATRYAGMDLFVDPVCHRRGYATDALRVLVAWLFDKRGHHRLVIDPHVENVAAVACYEKVGFKRVGVMREYIRVHGGPWRDALLMEQLATDRN